MAHTSRERLWKFRGIKGMSEELYYCMLEEQKGLCYLCGLPPGRYRLAADHDHITGKPRRLLCSSCNHALERLERFDGWGSRAQQYLEEFA